MLAKKKKKIPRPSANISLTIEDKLAPVVHYGDVMMGTIASQITSFTIVFSTAYSGADQRKHQSKAPRHWPLCGEFTGDRWIPRTNAGYAENVSIWWRHHVRGKTTYASPLVRNDRKQKYTFFLDFLKSIQNETGKWLLLINVMSHATIS